MSYRPGPRDREQELERLTEGGPLRTGMVLERDGEIQSPVLVRPVVGDAEGSWVPELVEAIGASRGVVAFSGTNMEEAASVAADAAAWLGERGKSLVLVDAAIERRVLGKPLAEDGDEGLVDAVLFGVSPEVVTRRTLSAGVHVVTAGSYPVSVEEVFDGPGLPPVLDALSEENLVLLLVSPVHLFKVGALLSAAVCVAADVGDIESLSKSIGDVRAIGVLVSEPGAAQAPAEAVAVQGEETPELEEAPEAEEPPATEQATPEGEALEVGHETAPEALEAEQPAGEAEEAPIESSTEPAPAAEPIEEPVEEPAEETTQEPVEEPTSKPMATPVNGAYVNPTRPADQRRHEKTPPLKEPEPVERKRGTRVPLYGALVLVLAIVWWFVDGQHRLTSGSDGPLEPQGERVAERTATGGQDAVASRSDSDNDGTTGSPVPRQPEPAETDAGSPPAVEQHGSDGEISGPGGRYLVMISSHYREIAAVLESAELENRGVSSEVVPADLGDRGVWYRVVVSGGYPSLADARSVLDTIKSFGYEGAWIERAPASR